jgi:hypothetical protein
VFAVTFLLIVNVTGMDDADETVGSAVPSEVVEAAD